LGPLGDGAFPPRWAIKVERDSPELLLSEDCTPHLVALFSPLVVPLPSCHPFSRRVVCIGGRWACSDVRREAVDTARPEGTPFPIGSSVGSMGGERMTTLFVGIDVSQNAADVCFLDREGIDLGRFKIANDLPGAEQLVRRITSITKQRQLTTVVIGLEATGMLGWHLRTYLSQVSDLQPCTPRCTCSTLRSWPASQAPRGGRAVRGVAAPDPGSLPPRA
jgi:hypothetical protein